MNLNSLRLGAILLCLVSLPSLQACRQVAVASAPERIPQPPSEATAAGTSLLARALLAGDYNSLPAVIEELTRLSIGRPRDGRLHLTLGMAHLWALSERERSTATKASITDHAILARHYLLSARTLLPEDARIEGWSGAAQLATAALLEDERGKREGFFELEHAIGRFPEFNGFSASYSLSRMEAADPRYDAAVIRPLFDVFERCWGAGATWSERRSRLRAALGSPADAMAPKRVCFNSQRAPHNVEGFFLHFGDALAKAGRAEEAKEAWGLAQVADSYASWTHREALEERIATAQAKSRSFAAAKHGEGMMIGSRRACAACHQR